MRIKKDVPNSKRSEEIVEMWKALEMSPQQMSFVYYYCLNDFDEKKAVELSDYSKNVNVKALFNNDKVKKAIAIYMNAVLAQHKTHILHKAIDVLSKRAFYDPFMFYDTDGQPKFSTMEDVPVEWRVVVDGIEQKFWGKDAMQTSVILKLADRQSAIKELTKLLELSKETIEIKNSVASAGDELGFTFNLNVLDTTTNNPLKKKMEEIARAD